MKIAIINGSPKGKYGITFQYPRYLQSYYKDHEFVEYHVGQSIKKIERDEAYFDGIIEGISQCDLVLWCYPVYTFSVTYQLMRFLELIFERRAEWAFEGKYGSQILTSKHFFDNMAYNYMIRISESLKMGHIPGHQADSDDLKTAEGQSKLQDFFREVCFNQENKLPLSKKYSETVPLDRKFSPTKTDAVENKSDYKILIVTDVEDGNSNLGKMIEVYRNSLPNEVTVLNLNDIKMNSGCLGCLYCTFEGHCVIKDEFQETFNKYVLPAECIIYAGEIKHHWFKPVWKRFDDRQFCNGHRILSMGKPVGYIISGALQQESDLREMIDGRSAVGHVFLMDVVTDENSDEETVGLLKALAKKTIWALENKPQRPVNFLGIGGMKVFRDLIYTMRGFMREDHKFYKKHGFYDFPQKNKMMTLQSYTIGLMMRSEKIRKKVLVRLKHQLIKDYDKIIQELDSEEQ